MKKKWIILISILPLVFACVLLVSTHREPPIIIKGDLSVKDVAEIKNLIRSGLRHYYFHLITSQSGLKNSPSLIKEYSELKIAEIIELKHFEFTILQSGGVAAGVFIRSRKDTGNMEHFVGLDKGTNGWEVTYLYWQPR